MGEPELMVRETLVHYSAKPLGPITSTPLSKQSVDMKPRGFWISVDGNDDGWREWCVGEEYGLSGLVCKTVFEIAPDADILWLRTVDDIDRFTETYEAEQFKTASYTYRQIDWRPVAERYQGIIIAPYQWERRLCVRSRWYYSWDCASGCIWNASAIRRSEGGNKP